MIVWWLVACRPFEPDLPTALTVTGDLDLRLTFQGELVAKRSRQILAPEFHDRPAIAWLVADGGRVSEGDELVVFETKKIREDLQQAKQQLQLTEAKLAEDRARLALAEAQAERDITSAELELRLAEMSQTTSETVPLVDRQRMRVELEKARIAADEARTGRQRARFDGATERQLHQLEAHAEQLKIDKLEHDLEATVLRAPGPGLVILERGLEVGSTPWPGALLATLPDLREMLVVGWVHEVDAPALSVGQTATITMDAHPSTPASGELTELSLLASPRGDHGIKHFRAELSLAETHEEMKPGMTVSVDLLTHSFSDVILVPPGAIGRHDGRPVVWAREASGWRAVEVEVLGASSDQIALSGVEVGTELALAEPPTWEGP